MYWDSNPPFDIKKALDFVNNDFAKLVSMVRHREEIVLKHIEEQWKKQKKPLSRKKRATAYSDEQYHVVRFYGWRKGRNEGKHIYVNTLNIRKGNKIIYKVGYVINTDVLFTQAQKTRFDKDADWR